MGSDSAYGEPFYGEPADEVATLRERLAASERRAEEAEAKYAHIADGYIAAQKLLDDERERVEKWIAYTEQLKEEKGLLHESLNGCAEKLASERAARERAERELAEWTEARKRFAADRARLDSEQSSLSRAVEALREEAAWLKDMAERTNHYVMPSSCGERAERVRAVLAEVDEVGRAAQERKEDRWIGSDMAEEGDK